MPVCPEALGGLGIPRLPAEIRGGDGLSVLQGCARVVNAEGRDVTREYVDGASKALLIGLQAGCSAAILKSRSPSCGLGAIYDGSFTGSQIAGDGVLAALCRKQGMKVQKDTL